MPNSRHVRYIQRWLRVARGILAAIAIVSGSIEAPAQTPNPQPTNPQPTNRASGADGNQHSREIATRASGGEIRGRLSGAAGGIVFTSVAGLDPVPIGELRHVRFAQPPADERTRSYSQRLLFPGRQAALGYLSEVGADHATIELFAGGPKRIPRSAITGLLMIREANPTVDGGGELPLVSTRRRFSARQDILVLRSGDEIFGKLADLDRRSARMNGPAGWMTTPLDQVSAIHFATIAPKQAAQQGVFVKIELRSPRQSDNRPDNRPPGGRPEDFLLGKLLAAEEHIEIEHPQLGRLAIKRNHVERMEVLHVGTRMEIDPRYHHLGNETRSDFDVAEPAGPELALHFETEHLPAGKTFFSLWTTQLEGQGPSAKYADQLAAGHLRTVVVLNGHPIDYLNHYLARASDTASRIRVPLPRQFLQAGRNRIKLVQTPQQGAPREFDDCGVFGLALEIEAAP